MKRALTGSLRSESVTIVSPEDFVLLKVLSTRERDLDDAKSVVHALDERLDLALIREEGRRLAEEITDHNVQERLQIVLSSSPLEP